MREHSCAGLRRRVGWRVTALLMMLLVARPSLGVPAFARQTGFECATCHVSWPELISVGRQFKLGGYTLLRATDGPRPLVTFDKDAAPPWLPLAAFVEASVSHTAKPRAPNGDASFFARDNGFALQQVSVLLAGRVAEHVGGFVQWTYDGIAHHSSVDNVDLRLAGRYVRTDLDVSYGLSVNNNPTVSDLYNSTPVWGFPFATSAVAATPAAATLVEQGLAQQVAGVSAYALWNHTLYVELGGYRTADGVASLLRAGVDRSKAAVLRGMAPYWRLALQREWDGGTQSAMLGTFGLVARKYPDPLDLSTPTDRFSDVGIDAQYQFVTDRHRVSAQVAYIHERQRLDGTFATGGSVNASDHLDTLNAKATYYFLTRYGVTLGYRRLKGSTDAGLYSTGEQITGSASGRPDSSAAIIELNWLPWRDRRISLQYTAYQKFNGRRSNYDGFGRNASDNNTLFLVAWLAF